MSGWIDDPVKPLCNFPVNYLEHSTYKFLMNYDGSSFYLTFLNNQIIIDRIYLSSSGAPVCYYILLFRNGRKKDFGSWPDYLESKKAYDKAVEMSEKYLALF